MYPFQNVSNDIFENKIPLNSPSVLSTYRPMPAENEGPKQELLHTVVESVDVNVYRYIYTHTHI